MTLDDRIAWAHYEFTDELLNGETVEEWITLSGKQGDDKEGVINVILSFSVSQLYTYRHICVRAHAHTHAHTKGSFVKWKGKSKLTSLNIL